MRQGDIYNPESIKGRYPYHRSICAFVFYNLTGKSPIKNPVPKVLTYTILMKAGMLFPTFLPLGKGKRLSKFQRKTNF
jgi:hypothetical protein